MTDEALAIWSSEAPDEINKKFALQLPKQDFYSFKLCTVDKVHAVRAAGRQVRRAP